MDIKLSQRAQSVKPSPTLAVTAQAAKLRAEGHDIIGLGAGEPDFDTPEHIKEAGIQAMRDGFTKYTPVAGTAGLKKAIIDKFARENNLEYADNQILVSCGAKHSLYNLMQALLDSNDEVIVPAPFWASYPDMAILAGAKPVFIETGMENDFKMTPEQLSAAINYNTRLVILNSPSNPTGACYTPEELTQLGKILKQHPDITVVTDDIYEHILWGQDKFCNILNACPDLYEHTVVVNGVSKAYSMTGWRIGYVAGPANLVNAMKNIQSQSTSNPASIAQFAAQAALEGPQDYISKSNTIFKERHDYVFEKLSAMSDVKCRASEGTFYIFPDFNGVIERLDGVDNDLDLAAFLLEKAGVAIVPGSAFGAQGYMRLSFATSMENLEQGLERIGNAIA